MQIILNRLWKNEALQDKLSRLIASGHLAHAYVIEGSCGSGKKTIALEIAKALSCENSMQRPCNECSHCRKIARWQSPDVRMVDCGTGKSISVASIREMREDVFILPNDLNWKIYLIDQAERMTSAAQNAFLKVLEEPPENVLFLLLCEDRHRLLSTILSRIQVLQTETFSDVELSALLEDNVPTTKEMKNNAPQRFGAIVHQAQGSIGKAMNYLDKSEKELSEDLSYTAYTLAKEIFSLLCPPENVPTPTQTTLFKLLSENVKTRECAVALLPDLISGIRDILLYKKSPATPLLFFSQEQEMEQFANRFSENRCIKVANKLNLCLERAEANPAIGLFLMQISIALI